MVYQGSAFADAAVGSPTVAVVVLAGGSGLRVGHDRNKAYLPLGSRTAVGLSLSTMAAATMPGLRRLVLVVRGDDRELAERTLDEELPRPPVPVELVVGGSTRHGSERQALRHLEHEGLVTAGHRSMLRVNSLSPVQVRELFRVRATLEGLAASQIASCAHRTNAADNLRSALARLVDTDPDFIARVDADLAFHLLLCQLSDNSVLIDTWRQIEGRLRVVIVHAGPIRTQLLMSPDGHETIIDTIESGDPAATMNVLDEHMALAAKQLAVGPRLL